jgi:hypothetical protein
MEGPPAYGCLLNACLARTREHSQLDLYFPTSLGNPLPTLVVFWKRAAYTLILETVV